MASITAVRYSYPDTQCISLLSVVLLKLRVRPYLLPCSLALPPASLTTRSIKPNSSAQPLFAGQKINLEFIAHEARQHWGQVRGNCYRFDNFVRYNYMGAPPVVQGTFGMVLKGDVQVPSTGRDIRIVQIYGWKNCLHALTDRGHPRPKGDQSVTKMCLKFRCGKPWEFADPARRPNSAHSSCLPFKNPTRGWNSKTR